MTPWTPPPGTRGLIFDCDGTLADTMPIHFRAWKTMLDPHGIPFTEPRFYSLGGMPTSKIIRLLSDESGIILDDMDGMMDRKEALFVQHFLTDVKGIENVVQIAESFRNVLPMAVASGGYRRIVEKTLTQLNVHDWFDAILCAEDTVLHKPEPDVFLEAARRIDVEPKYCVAFEDTDIGLEAIRRAGMTGVDVRPWLPVGHGGRLQGVESALLSR